MAWQQNPTSGVYYNMETGQVSQPGNPPPGFVPPPAQGSYEQLMAAVAPQLVSGGEGGDYMNSGGTGTWQGPSGTIYNIIGSRVFNFNPGQAGYVNPADAPILSRSGLYQTTAQDASDAMNPDAPGNGNGGGGLLGRGGAFSDPEFWGGLASVVLPGVGNALGLSAEAMAAAKAATAAATGGNPLLAAAGSYAGNALSQGDLTGGGYDLGGDTGLLPGGAALGLQMPSDIDYAARAASDITPTSMGAPSFNVTDVTSDTFGAGGVTSPAASVVSEAIGTPSALDISGGLDQAVAPLDISGGLDQAVTPAAIVAGTTGAGSALDISGGLDQAVVPAATVAAVGGAAGGGAAGGGATGGGYDLGGDTGLTGGGSYGGEIAPSDLAAGNPALSPTNEAGQSLTGSVAETVGAGGTALTVANAAAAGTALSRILGGTATTADWISVLGTAGAGLYGASVAGDQAKAYKDVADQFAGYGAPYRQRLSDIYADPSTFLNSKEVQKPVQMGSDIMARSLSMQGNPTGSGNALQQLQSYSADQLFGRLGQEKDRLGGFGGLSGYNAAAPSAAGAAIQSMSGAPNVLAATASDIFNPKPTMAENLFGYKTLFGRT